MDGLTLFKIVGGIISVLNFLIVIIVAVGGWIAFKKITTNDLHHMSADIKAIGTEQKCMKDKLISVSEDVSYLKGSLDVRQNTRARNRKAKTVAKKEVKNGR